MNGIALIEVIKSFVVLARTCKPRRVLHAAYHNR